MTRAEIAKTGASTAAPALARAEVVDKATRARLEGELEAAIRRRPAQEQRLAGVLRVLGPLSPSLRVAMADAAATFIRRGTADRELYGACIRALGEARDRAAKPLLRKALQLESGGGMPTLSAACFSTDPELAPLLAKVAGGPKAHLAFAAEVARVARGESNGQRLASIAPMIKECHRLALCAEVFVPLAYRAGAPRAIAAAAGALAVLRGAERHLGRWLVMGEVAAAAGEEGPFEDALVRASAGPSTARSAWSLVAWALETRLRPGAVQLPMARPTVEIISRLSDRPSADRDVTFLFRMARAGAASVKPMLESIAKDLPLSSDAAIRSASFLAKDHGRADLAEALLRAASAEGREELRGIATAALHDVGDPALVAEARRLAGELLDSRSIVNAAWGVLVRAAAARGVVSTAADVWAEGLASEAAFRWLQRSWIE
jgi:hypothetical protein